MSARASNVAMTEPDARSATLDSMDAREARSTTIRTGPSTPLRTGRLEARRERLMEEGRRLFLAKGYAGASVNEIVRLAGGSLATLYGEFGSKEGLFAEIMRQRAHIMYGWDEAVCFKKQESREGLRALGKRLLDRVLEEESLGLYRIAISEGPRFAELRKAVLEDSFPLFIQSLGDALIDMRVATAKDSTALAEEFLSLLHGQLVFRAACSGGHRISTRCRAQHVEQVVERFLALHPPRKSRLR
jgi:AcrR family transcriptional regulator